MKKGLLIIGAGGHGKVSADIAKQMDNWSSIAFLDDNELVTECSGYKVVGKIADIYKYIDNSDFFIAIGSNGQREKVQIKLENHGASVVSLIHPNSIIGSNVNLGIGTVIMPGVIINNSSMIGKGCIINTACSIDHDNFLEDYVHLSPGVHTAGNVKIGKNTWLGIGSLVSNNVEIGSYIEIGAGAVVVRDLQEKGTYVGVPARKLIKD